ncbi:hypothetical protein O3M35_011196 [Rhynocoris fuscipes]|uniref:C2H2-type domain-containing protein n=1 Tax=Rhynocoris fuscipes TaxID=488301 RepID=A0AAW1CUV3_9HEMI
MKPETNHRRTKNDTNTLFEDYWFLFLKKGSDLKDLIYRCPNCGKRYRHKESLYNHTKYQCGIEPQFSCDQCDYKTRWKAAMKKHTLLRHSDFQFI